MGSREVLRTIPLALLFTAFGQIHATNIKNNTRVNGSPPLHDSLSPNIRDGYFVPEPNHWQTCEARLNEFEFSVKVGSGYYASVFEVFDSTGAKSIMKAQIIGVSSKNHVHCVGKLCKRIEVVTRTAYTGSGAKRQRTRPAFQIPNEVAVGLLLNSLNSPTFPVLYEWTFCNVNSALMQTGMTDYFNDKLKIKYAELEASNNDPPTVVTLYLRQSEVKPAAPLTDQLTSNGLRKWVTHDRTGERGLLFLKLMFTQIFASLYEAQEAFGFTHYDLHTNNVLLHAFSVQEPLVLGTDNLLFRVDARIRDKMNIGGWGLKIIDFGFASATDPVHKTQFKSAFFEEFGGFHPTYDARLFTSYVLHYIDLDILEHIQASVSKEKWHEFVEMIEYALGSQVLEYFVMQDMGDASFEDNTAPEEESSILQFARGIRSMEEDPRKALDAMILKEGRSNVQFMKTLLGMPFFREFRV